MDIAPLWVHITCAWFQPEVSFASDEKMEPALGILRIPSSSFVKVMFLKLMNIIILRHLSSFPMVIEYLLLFCLVSYLYIALT